MAQGAGATMVGRTLSYKSINTISTLAMIVNRGDVTRWTNGTGSFQFNKMYEFSTGLSPGVGTPKDLSGILTDPFGESFVLTKAKHIYVWNPATVAGDILTISGNIFGAWGDDDDSEILGPSSPFLRESPIDGYTVTAGTQDTLSITNNGANGIQVYGIVLGI